MKLLIRLSIAVTLLLLPVGLQAQLSARLTQVVQQAVPPLNWSAPASIGYGTALDGTELNASSPVAGTFVYTPAAGTILPEGQQTLSVTFTPSDPNYTVATAQVPLLVRSALGSTFRLEERQTARPVYVPGDTLTVWLVPVGDFHQPVTLSCAATGGYSCTLGQSVMYPVSTALPVRVTIRRLAGQASLGPDPGGALRGMVVLLVVVLGRKRLRRMALLLVVLGVMSGCGTTRTGVATVTGKSLTETKVLPIQILDTR